MINSGNIFKILLLIFLLYLPISMIFWYLKSVYEDFMKSRNGFFIRHSIGVLVFIVILIVCIVLIFEPNWIFTGFKYVILIVLAAFLGYSIYLIVQIPYYLLKELILSPKEFFRNYKFEIFLFLGFIALIAFIVTFRPVWNGIENGLSDVWSNLEDIWLVKIVGNIFLYIIGFLGALFIWMSGISVSLFLGGLIFGMLLIESLNFILKKISTEIKIPLFPYPFERSIFFLITILCWFVPSVYIFFKLFWDFLPFTKGF